MTTFLRTSAGAEQARWLVRLRWWAILGQLVLLLIGGTCFGFELPWPWLSALLCAQVACNLLLRWRVRAGGNAARCMAASLFCDVALVTGVLYLTGGHFNPFTFIMLVPVAVAALLLPPRAAWSLTAFALLGLLCLFFDSLPLLLAGGVVCHDMGLHLRGMWVATATAAVFVLWFVHRLSQAIAGEHAARLRAERFAAVASLAAGAAHDLSTPLATIAVAIGELQRRASRENGLGGQALADVELVARQVARCRTILERMASDAGAPADVRLQTVRVADVLAAVQQRIADDRLQVVAEGGAANRTVSSDESQLVSALAGLVQNALQASGESQPVTLRARPERSGVCIEVVDRGTGIAADQLPRVGEPFYSTRGGAGMGLGVFLARTIAERLGGHMHITSRLQHGTSVRVQLPAQEVA